MAYHDYDEEPARILEQRSVIDNLFIYAVRTAGVLLLLIGMLVSIKVVLEVFALYQEPAGIERFAEAVARGSNLDELFTLLEDSEATASTTSDQQQGLRMSYFLAWGIVLFLLFIAGRLALGAVRIGGELALYDAQLKQFARTMLGRSLQHQPRSSQATAGRPVRPREQVRPVVTAKPPSRGP
jgi:hypothetical protein